MPRRNYKPGDELDPIGLQIFECTAFMADGQDLLIYTDEGGENPIRVPNSRIGGLINAAIAALRGQKGTW